MRPFEYALVLISILMGLGWPMSWCPFIGWSGCAKQ
jgi:hypothetical protein